MKEFIPLISTLLGGMLALVGGIISVIFVQRQTTHRENKRIQIEKAELLYKMVLKLDHLAQVTSNIVKFDAMKGKAPEDGVVTS